MKHLAWATSLVCGGFVCGCGESASTTPSVSSPSTPTASSTEQPIDARPSNAGTTSADANSSKSEASAEQSIEPRTRRFTFHYRFKVKDLTPSDDAANSIARVWLPAASSSDEQDIKRLETSTPGEISENVEEKFGNRVLFFEAKIPESGEFTVDVPYEVTRREVLRRPGSTTVASPEKLSGEKRDLFLRPDAMVPINGKPLKLLDMIELVKDRLRMARQLYDLVDNHVTYKKEGTEWGRGDTNWVCDSGFGNCTDFHSLFISLARSQGLPARFEIGFSIPTDKPEGPITGYHCWAWFYTDERGWIPVDISEADKNPMLKDYYFGGLTPDRVTFTVGRDLELVPKAAGQPLNFFIYPHIEVGGKALPKTNIELQFTFKEQS